MSYTNRVQRARRLLAKLNYSLNKKNGEDAFMVTDPVSNFVVAGNDPITYSFTLNDVEEWINDQIQ